MCRRDEEQIIPGKASNLPGFPGMCLNFRLPFFGLSAPLGPNFPAVFPAIMQRQTTAKNSLPAGPDRTALLLFKQTESSICTSRRAEDTEPDRTDGSIVALEARSAGRRQQPTETEPRSALMDHSDSF
ncbi:hypothetical protein CRENBAI_009336 [Crenichthys baileyi]|uniref:Uncharacterized protein n=1 Tax=Crenichthys baileyi TaxID=28760 RepID=A0AAV9RMV5_9TELE